MPSSLNLFIRIPKGFSEQDVFAAIALKDICKISDVVIKKGKTTNNAIIMVDYWYKGTRHIRDTLTSGGPISVIVDSQLLLAYEFKPKPKVESSKVHPDQDTVVVDEFGRDIPRKSQSVLRADAPAFKPALRANAPAFVPNASLKIAPDLSDINQRLNEFATEAFIRQYEREILTNLKKMNEKGAIAPGAPEAPSKASRQSDDLEEGKLCEIVKKRDTQFTDKSKNSRDISKNKKIKSNCSIISAVRFSVPSNK